MIVDNNVLFADTLIAPSAIVANRFVGWNGAQAGADVSVLAVAATAADINQAYTGNIAGRLTVEAGAAIAIGQRVKSDALGRAIPAAAGEEAAGKAITAAIGLGAFVRILRFPAA